MTIRKTIMLLGLALTVAALSPAAALAKAGGTDRPLTGSGSGTLTLNLPTGAFASDATEVDSHSGKVTVHSEGTFVLTGPGTFAVSGTSTSMAANGDQLTSTFTGTGTISGTESTTTIVSTLTGGTGRFEDVSGTATTTSHGTTISSDGVTVISSMEYTLTGTISY
jgi:hypothetical protein